jgi:DDE superfamily endonuclease
MTIVRCHDAAITDRRDHDRAYKMAIRLTGETTEILNNQGYECTPHENVRVRGKSANSATQTRNCSQIQATLPPGTPIEVWFQDEMRVGQKNKLTYRWARKGSRPRAVHDQRTQSTYLFGAVCPERGTTNRGFRAGPTDLARPATKQLMKLEILIRATGRKQGYDHCRKAVIEVEARIITPMRSRSPSLGVL